MKRALIGLSLLLLVGLVAVVVVFMVNNAHWVIVRFPTLQLDLEHPFPTVEYDVALPLVMLGSVIVGFLVATFLFLPGLLRRLWERQREHRFIKGLEGELAGLRTLPATEPAPLEDIPETPRPRAASGAAPPLPDEDELLAAALRDADREAGR